MTDAEVLAAAISRVQKAWSDVVAAAEADEPYIVAGQEEVHDDDRRVGGEAIAGAGSVPRIRPLESAAGPWTPGNRPLGYEGG